MKEYIIEAYMESNTGGAAMGRTVTELIRCKNCEYSEDWYADRRRCFLWSEDGISVFDNGFCNYAEPKVTS